MPFADDFRAYDLNKDTASSLRKPDHGSGTSCLYFRLRLDWYSARSSLVMKDSKSNLISFRLQKLLSSNKLSSSSQY